MDALDRLLVDLGFGFAKLAEYCYGVRAGRFGEIARLDELFDVREVPMRTAFARGYMVFRGGDAGALDLFERHRGPGGEGMDGIRDGVLVGAGIGQRAHEHVAADPRKS